MSKINSRRLTPGDRVVIKPGIHHESLAPQAAGTKENPVIIEFAPGRHEFRADQATNLCYFVSNSADALLKPRPIGILLKDCRHVQITGAKGSEIWFGDRMTMFINDHSEDITYSGLTFDCVRPTVSECRVISAVENETVVQVAEGSTYEIKDGKFAWTGDLGEGWVMGQVAYPTTGKCFRMGRWYPFANAIATDMGGGKIRLAIKGRCGENGQQWQFRNTFRDNTSAVNTRCKDIIIRDCNFYSLPGMGIVSQFTENITYQRVNVVPRPGTIRTCPAWADCFHFSGCRGDIVVDSCNFSGTQDDPINVHGTHLRIIEKTEPDQVVVRFMHPQTYGFAAFQPGDQVEFVNWQTLRGYATNTVTGVERRTDKDWVVTFEQPVAEFGPNDVVDNITWYPNFTARNNSITLDPVRGFLITSRGKVVVEGNTFNRCAMPAILVEGDASGWFESGPVRDLLISSNRFIACSIAIGPHGGVAGTPVHQNIRIKDNYFEDSGVAARSVSGLTITGNRFSGNVSASTSDCQNVNIGNNQTNVKE